MELVRSTPHDEVYQGQVIKVDEEQFFAESTKDNVYLSLEGRLRQTGLTDAAPYVVDIDSVVAGKTVDLLLQTAVQHTSGSAEQGGIVVSDDHPHSGTLYQSFLHFAPDANPHALLNTGVFRTGSQAIASTYDFRLRDKTQDPSFNAGKNNPLHSTTNPA